MNPLDVIILAGGKGTRLSSILSDIPKPMAPINGRPFLDILLSQLNSYPDIKNVILAVGYKSDIIMAKYRDYATYDFKILFSEEKVLLGTGGAIKKALSLTNTEDVLVLNGDSYIDFDIDSLINFYKTNSASMTIVLKEISDSNRYGSVKIDDQLRILSFEEKGSSNHTGLINAGVYLIKKNLFDNIEEDHEISFERQILPVLIKGNTCGYITSGRFIDIGVPETYLIADEFFKDGLSINKPANG
ncbi:MAG: nucleotidyltransferase family protein [Proteobacteria bacterium]|nr:nucleotidyltransferase family protein [Pseudomonadota bacterium]